MNRWLARGALLLAWSLAARHPGRIAAKIGFDEPLAHRIDDTVAGAEGENGPARWLARTCGQSFGEARRVIETNMSRGW